MRHESRGFTLIELLVVISIVGMLSSIVLVSLKSARDKGNVAAGLTFASHNHSLLALDAYFRYDFNATNPYLDTSGKGSTVSCIGFCNVNNDTPSGSGKSLAITPGAIMSYTVFDVSNVSDFTVSIWVKPTTLNAAIQTVFETQAKYPTLGFSTTNVSFGPSDTQPGGIYATSIPVGKWTQITYTYSTSLNRITGYINGREVHKYTPVGVVDIDFFNTGTLQIYTNAFLPFAANIYSGLIDDFTFYAQTLTTAQIQQMYAQESIKHNIAMQ